MAGWGRGRREGGITEGQETSGNDRYVYYLDCGDGYKYMSKLPKLCALIMRSLLHVISISIKLLKKTKQRKQRGFWIC